MRQRIVWIEPHLPDPRSQLLGQMLAENRYQGRSFGDYREVLLGHLVNVVGVFQREENHRRGFGGDGYPADVSGEFGDGVLADDPRRRNVFCQAMFRRVDFVGAGCIFRAGHENACGLCGSSPGPPNRIP